MFEVDIERDVVYCQAPGYWKEASEDPGGSLPVTLFPGKLKPLDLDMDIYKPAGDGCGRRPLLVMMHGGSFFIGNKNETGQSLWCRHFASLGYVAASINYRMGFRLSKKAYIKAEDRAVEDADAALAYLLGRSDLCIDSDRIFAAGTSAGAIVALRLAFRPAGGNYAESITGGAEVDVTERAAGRKHPRIRAVGNFWGSVRDLSVLENASTPILSFQATEDPIMPYRGGYPFKKAAWGPSRIFAPYMYGTGAVHERALQLGIRAEHHAYPMAKHRLHLDREGNPTPVFYEIQDRMEAFFGEELS